MNKKRLSRRNKNGNGRQHSCNLKLRLTPEEKRRLEFISQAQRMSQNDVLRNYIWSEFERTCPKSALTDVHK